jgi:hypothetical protein
MCDKISGTQGHLQMIQNPFVGFTSPFFFGRQVAKIRPKQKKHTGVGVALPPLQHYFPLLVTHSP